MCVRVTTIPQFLTRFLLPLSHAGLTRIGGIAVVGGCGRRWWIGVVLGIGGRVRRTRNGTSRSCCRRRRIVGIGRRRIVPLGLVLGSGGRSLIRRVLIRIGAALGDVGRGSFVASSSTGSYSAATSSGHRKTRVRSVECRPVGTYGLGRTGTAGAAGGHRRGIGRVRRERGRTVGLLVGLLVGRGLDGISSSRRRGHVTLRLLLLLLLMLSRCWCRRRNIAVGR